MLEHQGDADNYEDSVNDLPPGTQLMHGQYTIEQYLSSGGFGITYLARDSLNRYVVIKECFPSSFCRRVQQMVRPHSRENADELAKIVSLFTQEALSLARVEHPNIVGVHQVFEENNTAYMALDFVRGHDLQEIALINKIAMTPIQITSILTKVLDAIGHVHKNDLLHRDISPDNIIIRDDGEPVLIDFGAAREQSTRKTRVLSAMQIVKDGYSPQEFYVADSNQSPSCDLYSLAATFYHVISGQRPPDAQRRITALASQEPDPYVPLAALGTDYDEKFCAILDKALQVLPQDRVQTAEDWLHELGRTETKRRISKRVLEPEVVLPATDADEADAPAPSDNAAEAEDAIARPANVTRLVLPNALQSDEETPAAAQDEANFESDNVEIVAETGSTETPDKREEDEDTFEAPKDDAPNSPNLRAVSEGWSRLVSAPARIQLPSIVSVPKSGDEADLKGANASNRPRRLAAVVLIAGLVGAGGWYISENPDVVAGLTGTGEAPAIALGPETRPLARPARTLGTSPLAETPRIAARPSGFPDNAEPVIQVRAAPIAQAPAVQVELTGMAAPGSEIESLDVTLPIFDAVPSAEPTVTLPEAGFALATLPQVSDAPEFIAAAPPAVTEAPVAAPTPVVDGLPDTSEVELTVVSEGLILASMMEDDQWVTSVVSATSDMALKVGDVIIADATTGAELDSPAKLRAMIEDGKAGGLAAIELAIERDGTFRFESLKFQ